MQTIDLTGAWRVRQEGGEGGEFPATVPGCVHTDLLAAGRIEDPFYRDNEDQVQWIGQVDWVYRRAFEVSAESLRAQRVVLRCEGLDTLATVQVNGKVVGRADNMFRTWEFDVKSALKAGANEIRVHLASTLPYIRKRARQRALPMWGDDYKVPGGNWVRKEQCNYGWDWGPNLVTCGIWRDIRIVAFDTARLADVAVEQDHAGTGGVALDVTAAVEAATRGVRKLSAAVTVSYRGRTVAEASAPVRAGTGRARLVVKAPKLWWPRGMGGQPLYDVTVDLLDADGALLDTSSRRVGLRTLRLVRKKDRGGESFHFEANGVPFFAKGANWIPADTFVPRLVDEDYADLLASAAAAHMNMLRVWGGGIYEQDVFYDLCDELGICLWQDFMFSCATYPTFDEEFLANVQAEAEDNVRRLRHHACLALWCGNNELEQGLVGPEWNDHQMSWADYKKLFDKLLPRVVRRLDPQRDYWPCSPHSPVGDRTDHRNPDCGDAHLWDVWHGGKPFEWYRTCRHRFCSEFGFQSFPEPKTVRTYTTPADRNVTSYVMEHHQRSGIGNSTILRYMLDWFRLPKGFDMTLWTSQILQGMAMKYAVENWRRGMGRSMGTLYWQLNDCWPVASWSSIDSLGRWKALHYLAKRFYAPLLVSGVEDVDRGEVAVHVTSDLRKARRARLAWRLTTVAGDEIAADADTITVKPGASEHALTMDLADPIGIWGRRDLLVWLDLSVAGQSVSSDVITFARPKHLELPDPRIAVKVESTDGDTFVVTLQAKRPALWAWLDLSAGDAHCSDNFFHLPPGEPVEVVVSPLKKMTASQLKKKLRVRSLVDTY